MLIVAAIAFVAEPPLSMGAPPVNRQETLQPTNRPPSAPAKNKSLADIPGVTITYYDVVGTTIPKLHEWLEKHAPRDPHSGKITPATSGWSIGAAVKYVKTGGQCSLTSATVKLSAKATLPRLAPGQKLAGRAFASWNAYVAALEDRHATRLAFVQDRLGEVQTAIMRSSCADWQKAAASAIDLIGVEAVRAFPLDTKAQPKLLQPDDDA